MKTTMFALVARSFGVLHIVNTHPRVGHPAGVATAAAVVFTA